MIWSKISSGWCSGGLPPRKLISFDTFCFYLQPILSIFTKKKITKKNKSLNQMHTLKQIRATALRHFLKHNQCNLSSNRKLFSSQSSSSQKHLCQVGLTFWFIYFYFVVFLFVFHLFFRGVYELLISPNIGVIYPFGSLQIKQNRDRKNKIQLVCFNRRLIVFYEKGDTTCCLNNLQMKI